MQRIILSLLLMSLLFTACKKDEEAIDYLARDIELIENYLASNGITAQKLPSGVFYTITKEGIGTEKPDISDKIVVYYKGYLLDGTIFDETDTNPLEIGLSQVILGWQEGLQQFTKESEGMIFIPSTLGYGSRPIGNIPENSVLIFEVELEDFF